MNTFHKTVLSAMILLLGSTAIAQETIVMDGSTTVGPIAKAFAEYYMNQNPGVNITVGESGSGNGATSLREGTCHVATMSRFMRVSEFKAALDNDVTPIAHVVALDGIAIIVHPSNPVGELTREQVRDIYAGRITNWREVGGPNRAIVAISRDTNSGTYETFNDLVMDRIRMAEGVGYVGSNGAIRARVQETEAAIGYVGIGFADHTVKALSINGVLPTLDTIRTGAYPIARPLYLFTNGYPELGSHLYRFITLYLTEEGQEMVESQDFIPMTNY